MRILLQAQHFCFCLASLLLRFTFSVKCLLRLPGIDHRHRGVSIRALDRNETDEDDLDIGRL